MIVQKANGPTHSVLENLTMTGLMRTNLGWLYMHFTAKEGTCDMNLLPDGGQIAQIFSQATAPAFLLGAVAGYVSILLGRISGILDRIRSIHDIDEDDVSRIRLRDDLPRLRRRVRLLSKSTYLALCAGICATLLLAVGFICAFIGLRHEPGAGLLFLAAVGLMGASLFRFAQEIKMGLSELDHFR
jgi:hypothetical protein